MNLKKIIALTLVVCMVLSFFPVSVFAEEWDEEIVLTDEEYYEEPQEEYVEEIIEEEPADYVEYVEPVEEIVVEDELPVEEPVVEEPAEEPDALIEEPVEEPAAPAAPVEEAAAPAAMTANLETAETFGAAPNFGIYRNSTDPDPWDMQPTLGDAVAAVDTANSIIKQEKTSYPSEGTAEAVTIQSDKSITFTGIAGATYKGDIAIASVVTIENITIDGNVTIETGATATLTGVTITGTVTANGGETEITGGSAKSVTLNGGNVKLSNVELTANVNTISVQSGIITIPAGDTMNYKMVTASADVTSGNIMGGYFYGADAVPAKLIRGGYHTEQEGSYVKVVKIGVAKVGDDYYNTFAEAVAAAEAATTDKTITIFEDITYGEMTNGKPLTIQKYYAELKLNLSAPAEKTWLYVDPADSATTEPVTYSAVFYHGVIGDTWYKTLADAAVVAFADTSKIITVASNATLGDEDKIELTAEHPTIKINKNTKNVNVFTQVENNTVVDVTEGGVTTFSLAPVVAYIGEVPYATLADAVDAAGATDTITLVANIALTDGINIDKPVTIDLAGYTITDAGNNWSPSANTDYLLAVKYGGKLTINDTSSGKTGAVTTENSNIYAAVKMTIKGETVTEGNYAELEVNGGSFQGYYYAISGNGSRHNTIITINGGNFRGVCEGDNLAIYHPQNGTLTINDGTFTGYSSAIEIRSGSLEINDGTFTATAPAYSCDPNGSGTTTVGAAIAVAQHSTQKDIAVEINGGIFTGAVALSESNPQGNVPDPKVTMSIEAGTFTGTQETQTTALLITDAVDPVSGGTFNKPVPEDYCAEGFIPTKSESGDTYGVKEGVYVVRVAPYATPTDLVVNGQGYVADDYDLAVAVAKATTAANPLVLVVLKTIDDPTTGVPAAQRTINLAASESINVYNESTVDAPVVPTLAEGTWNSANPAQDTNNVKFYTATLYAGNRYVNGTRTPVEECVDLVWWAQNGADYIEPTSPVPANFTRGLAENDVINVLQSSAYHFTAANFTTSIANTYIKHGTANLGTEDAPIMVDTFSIAKNNFIVYPNVIEGDEVKSYDTEHPVYFDDLADAVALMKGENGNNPFTNEYTIEKADGVASVIDLESLQDELYSVNFVRSATDTDITTKLPAVINNDGVSGNWYKTTLTAAKAAAVKPDGSKVYYATFAEAAAASEVFEDSDANYYVEVLSTDETPYPLVTGHKLNVLVTGEGASYKVIAKDGEPYYADSEERAAGGLSWTVKKHVASVTVDVEGVSTPFYGTFSEAAQIAWTNRNAEGVTPVVTLYADPLADDDFTIPASDEAQHLYETGSLVVKLADGYAWTEDVEKNIVKFPPAPGDEGSATENVGRYFGDFIPADQASGGMYVVTEAVAFTKDKGNYYHYFKSVDAAWLNVGQHNGTIAGIDDVWYDADYAPLLVKAVDVELSGVETFIVNTNGIDMTDHVKSSEASKYPTSKPSTEYPGATEWSLGSYVAQIYETSYSYVVQHDGTKTYSFSEPEAAGPDTGYKTIADTKVAYDGFMADRAETTFYYIELIADPGTEKYQLDVDEIVIYNPVTNYTLTFVDADEEHKQKVDAFSLTDLGVVLDQGDSVQEKPWKTVDSNDSITLTFTVQAGSPTGARFAYQATAGWVNFPEGKPFVQKLSTGDDMILPTLTLVDNPAYEFDSWYVDDVPVALPTEIPAEDTTYVAKWKPVEYTITYETTGLDSNDRSVTDVIVPTTPVSYTVVSDPVGIENASKLGYNFVGWDITFDGKETVHFKVDADHPTYSIPTGSTGNVTFVPVLANKNYTFTYNYEPGTAPAANPTGRWVNSAANTINNPESNVYTFTGWSIVKTNDDGSVEQIEWTYTDAERNYVIPTNTAASFAFTAQWDAISHNITYVSTGKDSFNEGAQDITEVTVPTKPASYTVLTPEADRTIENATKTGYGFDGWIITDGQTTENWEPTGSQQKFVIPAATNTDLTFTPVLHIHNYIVDGGVQYFDKYDDAIAAIKTDGKFTAAHRIEALAGAPTTEIELANMDDVLIAKGFTVTTTLEATISETEEEEGYTRYTLAAAVASAYKPNGDEVYYDSFAEAAENSIVYVGTTADYHVIPYIADTEDYVLPISDNPVQLTVADDGTSELYSVVAPNGYDIVKTENKDTDGKIISITYTLAHKVASVTYTDASGAEKTEYGTFKEIAGIAWDNRDATTGESPVVKLYAKPDYVNEPRDIFYVPLAQEGTNLYQTGTLVVAPVATLTDFAAFEENLVIFPPRPSNETLGSRTENEGRYFGKIVDANAPASGAKFVVTEAEAFTRDNGQYYHYFQTVAEAWTNVNTNTTWYPARYAPVLVKVVDVELTSQTPTFTVNTNNLDMTGHVTVSDDLAQAGKYAAPKASADYDLATEWSVSNYVANVHTVKYDVEQLNTGKYEYSLIEDKAISNTGYETVAQAMEAYKGLTPVQNSFSYVTLLAATEETYTPALDDVIVYDKNSAPTFEDLDDTHKVESVAFTLGDEGDKVADTLAAIVNKLNVASYSTAVNLTFKVATGSPAGARFYVEGGTTGRSGQSWYYEENTYELKLSEGDAYVLPSATNVNAAGYEFDSWYVDDEPVALPTEIPTEDTDYVAMWKPTEYTITYSTTGKDSNKREVADVTVPATPVSYTVESDDIAIGDASKLGYDFSGWYVDDATEPTTDYVIAKGTTGNISLVPALTNINYPITFEYNGGSLPTGVTNPTGRWINSGANTINNPEKTGATFAGWEIVKTNDDKSVENITFRIPEDGANYVIPTGTAASFEFTAIWTQKYELKLYKQGAATPTDIFSVTYGDVVPADQVDYDKYVPENHVFSKWVIEQSPELGNIEYTKEEFAELTMPAQDVELVAYTEPIEYTIALTVPNGAEVNADGYIVVNPENANPQNTTYEKKFTADELPVNLPVASEVTYDGHTFTGWFADGSQTAVTQITTAGNYALTGEFTTNVYPVAFYDRFNGTDTLLLATNAEYGTSIYELGKDLTATHTTSYYYDDSKWMDANNVVIDKDATVSGTASFYLNWKPLLSVIYKDPTGAVIYKTVSGLKTTDLLLTDAPELTPPQAGMVLYWTKIDGSYAKATELIVEPTELRSAWVSEEDIVTVTFNPANGNPAVEVPVIIGQKVDRPEDPVRTEFLTFDAWYADGETSAFDFDAPITEDVNLTAAWILDDSKVTANFGRTPALQENINLNAKLGLSNATIDSGVTSDMFYVEYIVDGETHRAEPFVPDNYNDYPGGAGKVFTTKTAEFFSYQMWKPIIIKFFFDDGGTDPVLVKQYGTEDKPYSLREYFDKQWDTTPDANLKTLVKSVLDYGASAQIYFDGRYETNVENLVNSHVNPDNIVEAVKPTNVAKKDGKIDGTVERVGATVRLDGDIKMSVKIQTEQMDKLKFSVPIGYAYEIDEEEEVVNNIHTVLVKGIKSNMLGNDILFTISGKNAEGVDSQIKYTYSPFTYAAKNWDSGDNLAGLCHAMVEYGNAARAYFGA